MAKPTIRQKLTFKDLLTAIETGGSFNLKEIMIKNGYSEQTANHPTANLLEKQGFKQLLAQIDDNVILAKLYEILISDDKRSSLSAIDMLMKLKNAYPDKKLKIESIESTLNELRE